MEAASQIPEERKRNVFFTEGPLKKRRKRKEKNL